MSKVHTSVKIRKDGSLVLPAFVMRGMGYAPGEEVPITTPADQYICDCDANSLLVSRVCGDAGCAGYTSEEPELNLPADLLAETDVLIDGPFVQEQRNLELRFRGSENQRLIDMRKTREQGHVVLVEE